MEVLAGVVGGVVSGLGMGGGSILIILLSLFVGVEQHIAQATNIVFFVPAALISIFLNFKSGIIKWKIAFPIIIFGIIGAIVGAQIALILNTESLKKFFGIFLGIMALYETLSLIKLYKKDKLSNNKNIKKD